MSLPIEDIDDALANRDRWRMTRIPAALAEEFAAHDIEVERARIKQALMIGATVLVALLLVDWMIIPDVEHLNILLRTLVGAPLGVLSTVVVARWTRTTRQHKIVGAAYAVCCSIICSYVLIFSHAPGAPIYLSANNIILAFVLGVMRPTFALSAVVTVLIMLIETLAAYFSVWFSISSFISVIGVTGGLAVPLLYANWCLDNEYRRIFLDQKRDDIRLETIANQRDMLARLAAIDELTGLPNRRGFDAGVSNDLASAAPDVIVAIAMIDIDNFKLFNDRYGHPAGDETLRRVAEALERAGLAKARIGRMGGEEFAVALIDINPEALDPIGARLCAAVERLRIPHAVDVERTHVTISVGIAWGQVADGNLSPLFSEADALLYEAKSRGRNRFVVSTCSSASHAGRKGRGAHDKPDAYRFAAREPGVWQRRN